MSFIEYPCFDGLPLECCSSENRERNHLSRSSGNQSFWIGDPLAPRTRIEPPCCQSGVFHRQQVVTGRDSGPAIADVPFRSAPLQDSLEFLPQILRIQKMPVLPHIGKRRQRPCARNVSRDRIERFVFPTEAIRPASINEPDFGFADS